MLSNRQGDKLVDNRQSNAGNFLCDRKLRNRTKVLHQQHDSGSLSHKTAVKPVYVK